MSVADRALWTLPMFHANGWTSRGRSLPRRVPCLPSEGRSAAIFGPFLPARIMMLCAAPTVLIGLANCPPELRAAGRARHHRRCAAGRRDDRAA
jgi:fatty-acyl-CoA synthase